MSESGTKAEEKKPEKRVLGNDLEQTDYFDMLDKLYKTLLAPTTFLALITWNYLVYLTSYNNMLDKEVPIDVVTIELIMFGFSLTSYILVRFERKKNLKIWGNGFSFFFLFSAILYNFVPVLVSFASSVTGVEIAPILSGLGMGFIILVIALFLTWWTLKKVRE